jgi:hypothetical protein
MATMVHHQAARPPVMATVAVRLEVTAIVKDRHATVRRVMEIGKVRRQEVRVGERRPTIRACLTIVWRRV